MPGQTLEKYFWLLLLLLLKYATFGISRLPPFPLGTVFQECSFGARLLVGCSRCQAPCQVLAIHW